LRKGKEEEGGNVRGKVKGGKYSWGKTGKKAEMLKEHMEKRGKR